MGLIQTITYVVVGISCLVFAASLFGYATKMYDHSKADMNNPYWHFAIALYSIAGGVWFVCFLITTYVARH